tara:strand:- start:282 stop:872 length:591 start_codon:yes stop_codon:yes gene_type:complete
MKNLFLILFLVGFVLKSEAFDLIIEPGIGLQHQGDLLFNDYNDTVGEADDSHVSAPVKNHISILTVDFGVKYESVSVGFRGEWSGPDFIANGLWSLMSVEDQDIGKSHKGKKFFIGFDVTTLNKIELTYGTKTEMKDGGSGASYDSSFGLGLSHEITEKFNINFNYGKLISANKRQSDADEVSLRLTYPFSFNLVK